LSVGYLLVINSGNKTGPGSIAEAPKQEQPISSTSVPSPTVPSPAIATTGNAGANSTVKAVTISMKKKPSLPKTLMARRITPAIRLGNDLAINIPSGLKQAPRLGIKDDEEDRSLRLSDLFDETNPPPQR